MHKSNAWSASKYLEILLALSRKHSASRVFNWDYSTRVSHKRTLLPIISSNIGAQFVYNVNLSLTI